MRTISKNYIALCLFCFACFANIFLANAQQNDSTQSIAKLPPLQDMRIPSLDIQHIALDLRFDWTKKQAYGKAAITLFPNNKTDKISLDAGLLTIQAVELENGKALKFSYDGGEKNNGLQITLDRFYTSKEKITVYIAYNTNLVNEIDPNNLNGSNGKGLRFSSPTTDDPIKPTEIWSIGEYETNRYWFPCYDAPNDWRTTEFRATIDKKLTAIANGVLVSKKDNQDGTHTFHYKTDKPYANHLTSFVVGEYTDFAQQQDKITLHNFGYPHEQESTAATVVRLPDMMKFFGEITGLPYPHSHYSQVFVQDIGTLQGNNTFSTITENMVDDEGTHDDFYYLWDLTEGEALATQWFGNIMTCNDWSEIWLNRAFAHYFSGLYSEYKNGREEYLSYHLNFDHANYFNDWKSGNRRPIVTKNYEKVQDFATDNYTYSRGAAVLNLLRRELGEEKWAKVVKLYVKNNAHKTVTTQNFIDAVNQVNAKPMNWFFEQWLYKIGHPIFEVTKSYDETQKKLLLTVKQTQKIDKNNLYEQVQFFKGTIEIEIDNKVERVWLDAKEVNSYTFDLPMKPKFVNFDYQSSWLKELTINKDLDELLAELENSTDILAKFAALGKISGYTQSDKILETEREKNKEKVKNCFRKVAKSNAYWRMKISVLWNLYNLMPNDANKTVVIDNETKNMLLEMVKTEKSWLKAGVINFLGTTKDTTLVDLYLKELDNKSDRIIGAAAASLGKTKSTKAFPAFVKLLNRPSMKSQSLLSALAGLRELGDKRGFEIAYNALADTKLLRWRLPIGSVWDFRVVAAQNIAALGKGNEAYPLIFQRFKQAIDENDLNGIFNNAQIIAILADARGQEAFELLKQKFKDNENCMIAVKQFETQFKNALQKP